MTGFEYLCVTGTGSVFTVLPEFAHEDYEGIGQQTELGSLDAPKYIAAGSMLSDRWFGLEGQRLIRRDERQ
jgi:hypothetical protein